MDTFEHPYYRLNKRLLVMVGQWPYQNWTDRFIRRCIVNLIFVVFVITQVSKDLIFDFVSLYIRVRASYLTRFRLIVVNQLSFNFNYYLQVSLILTCNGNIDVILESIPNICIFILIAVKYYTYQIQRREVSFLPN